MYKGSRHLENYFWKWNNAKPIFQKLHSTFHPDRRVESMNLAWIFLCLRARKLMAWKDRWKVLTYEINHKIQGLNIKGGTVDKLKVCGGGRNITKGWNIDTLLWQCAFSLYHNFYYLSITRYIYYTKKSETKPHIKQKTLTIPSNFRTLFSKGITLQTFSIYIKFTWTKHID